MRRYQLGRDGSDVYSKLYGTSWNARRALRRALKKGTNDPTVRWKREGKSWSDSARPRHAAHEILDDAKGRRLSTFYQTSEKDTFRLLVAEPITPTVPLRAKATRGTRLTLRFNQEMQLVFPRWKSLGLYVPRTLKDPGSTFWSEHAWAAANDTGMKDDRNPGQFETNPAVLTPFLNSVNGYIIANFHRLKVNESIYDRVKYRVSDSAKGFTTEPYTGSDAHTTHIHTQFANHNGAKPPWV